jgi:hypothetical protein
MKGSYFMLRYASEKLALKTPNFLIKKSVVYRCIFQNDIRSVAVQSDLFRKTFYLGKVKSSPPKVKVMTLTFFKGRLSNTFRRFHI